MKAVVVKNDSIKVLDTLDSTDIKSALSARQGKELKAMLKPAVTFAVGTIIGNLGNSVPAGWLACNGQAVSKETYADLYNIIGGSYGEVDSTFNLPTIDNMIIYSGV